MSSAHHRSVHLTTTDPKRNTQSMQTTGMFCKDFQKSMEFSNGIGKGGKYCEQRTDYL